MNILTLNIRQKFFDEILAGTKKQEFREIRPNSQSKYCKIDSDGFAVENDGVIEPRKYDAIKFLTGEYKGSRPYAIVEVAGANIELLVDEETQEPIEYEYEGEIYTAAQVVYDLGRVIEKYNV
ncbi:MAG: ASCH domain-containing protein [Tannerellaceae bacterium]|nr:ASCH domain-containing protein [Tannerellaceae bacterium]